MSSTHSTSSPLQRLRSVLALLLVGLAVANAGAAPADVDGVIVKFKSSRAASALSAPQTPASTPAATPVLRAQALGQRTGLRLRDGAALSPTMQVIHGTTGQSTAALVRALSADPQVDYVVENRRRRAHASVNDPLFAGGIGVSPQAGQWYLGAPNASLVSAVNAEAAWSVTAGRADVVVALLDSGVRFKHPDLDGKLLPGYDFVSEPVTSNDGDGRDPHPSDPGDWITDDEKARNPTFQDCSVADSTWHGTQVAGVLGAATHNGVGMAGMGRHVRILPVRVLGKCGGYDADIVAGMRWAGGFPVDGVPANPHPARILNLSLGSIGDCASAQGRLYREAIAELRQAGVTTVVSAGNDNLGVHLPANCAGVISVAGLRHAGDKGGASSLGPEVTLSAPEGNCVNTIGECLYPILSTTNSGKTGPQCSTYTNGLSDVARGTSFSAPMVAGTAALMLAAQPSLTPDQLAALLKSTARPFPSRAAGDTTPMCQPTTASTLKEQINCHCTSTTCGAGMLDSGAAVRAAAATGNAVIARLTESQARVPLNSTVQLSATGSTPTLGRTLSGYQWRITDGSALAQLTGATNAATATLASVGEGWVTVELAVTDSAGGVGRSSAVLRSGGAPAAVCGPDETDVVADAGGGGALAWPWLAGLALVVALLGLGRVRAHAG